MNDPTESVSRNVLGIFKDLVGDRAGRLDPCILSTAAMDTITEALSAKYGYEKADEIALNLADWNWEAAFLVALHLFPERFTREEIDAGIGLFLVHVPYHIREACRLTDLCDWGNTDDEGGHS